MAQSGGWPHERKQEHPQQPFHSDHSRILSATQTRRTLSQADNNSNNHLHINYVTDRQYTLISTVIKCLSSTTLVLMIKLLALEYCRTAVEDNGSIKTGKQVLPLFTIKSLDTMVLGSNDLPGGGHLFRKCLVVIFSGNAWRSFIQECFTVGKGLVVFETV